MNIRHSGSQDNLTTFSAPPQDSILRRHYESALKMRETVEQVSPSPPRRGLGQWMRSLFRR